MSAKNSLGNTHERVSLILEMLQARVFIKEWLSGKN